MITHLIETFPDALFASLYASFVWWGMDFLFKKHEPLYKRIYDFLVLMAGAWVALLLFTPAKATDLADCMGGCANAVVREIPKNARMPYSRENLTSLSYTQPIIPPVEYDYPYPGKTKVTRVNPQEMKLVCPKARMKDGAVLACTHLLDLPVCNIYMLDDATLKASGWNYEIVLRHEIAHCNGWPWTHPGIERPKL